MSHNVETLQRDQLLPEIPADRAEFPDTNEKIRTIEEMTIDYIGRNLYLNWKSAKEIKAKIKHSAWNIYSVEFEHEFKEWKKKIKMNFATKYENNSISMEYQNYQYGNKFGDINTTIEIDDTTHNQYDVVMDWNWNRINFGIVYNEYKTKEVIKNIIETKTLKTTPQFQNIEDLENTQLTWLNHPYLWKEVFKDDENWYYRTLFYSTHWKKRDVTKVYFKPNWDFDAEKTAEKKAELKVLWITVDYEINANCEFVISEHSRQELENKVRQDRSALIKILNDTPIADYEVFSWLNKQEKTKDNITTWQFNSEIISLDPISGIYSIKLNNDNDKNLEPLYCKVEWNNVVLVDETWKPRDTIYFNYTTKNKRDTNYYKISKWEKWLIIRKISNELQNPQEVLPAYTWDNNAISLLRKSGNLTNYDGGYLNHFDNKWVLIAKMPCDKTESGGYEFNDEKYHTQIEPLKLYNYRGFKNKVQGIKEFAADLWIADADIRDIFEKSLKNEGLDFNQKVVEITDPTTWESIYYNMDSGFRIERDKNLYKLAEKCIDSMQNRLRLAQIINNSKILWRNGKEYKDFELFVWWESGIGKQIVSPDQLKKFISWETNEITVKISRWKWESTDIIYTASWNKLRTSLKSWEWRWTVTVENQLYTIRTEDRTGNIILDPKEERE